MRKEYNIGNVVFIQRNFETFHRSLSTVAIPHFLVHQVHREFLEIKVQGVLMDRKVNVVSQASRDHPGPWVHQVSKEVVGTKETKDQMVLDFQENQEYQEWKVKFKALNVMWIMYTCVVLGPQGSPGYGKDGRDGSRGEHGMPGPPGYVGPQGAVGPPGYCDPSTCLGGVPSQLNEPKGMEKLF